MVDKAVVTQVAMEEIVAVETEGSWLGSLIPISSNKLYVTVTFIK